MSILPLTALEVTDTNPDDGRVTSEMITAAVSDPPAQIRQCGRRILLHLFKEVRGCFTVPDLKLAMPESMRSLIIPTLAYLQVEGWVGKHRSEEAMHYFLTPDGADRARAN